jgi:hypothetical protein
LNAALIAHFAQTLTTLKAVLNPLPVRSLTLLTARGFVQRIFRQTILAGLPFNLYSMRMDSREALIALNMIEGVGPVRARSLLEHFGDAPKRQKSSLRVATVFL